MADRYVLLREPCTAMFRSIAVYHIPAPDDDTSTLCGEPADGMDACEVKANRVAVLVCAGCMAVATR